MGAVGPLFGLSRIQSVRAGLLLAAGGEFAFVALCAPATLVIMNPHRACLCHCVVTSLHLASYCSHYLCQSGQEEAFPMAAWDDIRKYLPACSDKGGEAHAARKQCRMA